MHVMLQMIKWPMLRDMTLGSDANDWAALRTYGTDPLARRGRICKLLIAFRVVEWLE
jgi:hypothetical protein